MPVFRAQAPGELPGPSQAQRSQFDIQHLDRTVRYCQLFQVAQAPVSDQEQLAFFARALPPTTSQPCLSFGQASQQRRSASRSQLLQPGLQCLTAALALARPFRSLPRCLQDRDPDPLAIGLLEPVGQQAFGLGQGAVAAGGRGVIDDYQPELRRALPARLPQEIVSTTRTPPEQRRHPGDGACLARRTGALTPAQGLARPAPGITIRGMR